MHSEMFCTRRDCVLGKPDAASDGVAVDQERTGWPHPLHGIQHALRDVLQSRGGSAPAFASLSAAQRFPGALAQERHATKEINAGGTVFPLSYCHLSDKECPGLVGTGVRYKKALGIKNIDVYAMGLYIDAEAAERAVGKEVDCLPAMSPEHSEALAERVIANDDVEKSVRVVITSGLVNQPRFSKTLRDSLEPRIRQSGGDPAALDDFEGRFKGVHFYKGMEMIFTNTKRGDLVLRLDGKEAGHVASPALTRAFFDLYVGADPVLTVSYLGD